MKFNLKEFPFNYSNSIFNSKGIWVYYNHEQFDCINWIYIYLFWHLLTSCIVLYIADIYAYIITRFVDTNYFHVIPHTHLPISMGNFNVMWWISENCKMTLVNLSPRMILLYLFYIYFQIEFSLLFVVFVRVDFESTYTSNHYIFLESINYKISFL